MKHSIRTKSFLSALRQEELDLKNIIKVASNGVTAPVNRKMTRKEIIEFVNHQPEWCKFVWGLTGFEDKMIRG